jgi:hypothetical protein
MNTNREHAGLIWIRSWCPNEAVVAKDSRLAGAGMSQTTGKIFGEPHIRYSQVMIGAFFNKRCKYDYT